MILIISEHDVVKCSTFAVEENAQKRAVNAVKRTRVLHQMSLVGKSHFDGIIRIMSVLGTSVIVVNPYLYKYERNLD